MIYLAEKNPRKKEKAPEGLLFHLWKKQQQTHQMPMTTVVPTVYDAQDKDPIFQHQVWRNEA